MGNSHSKPVGQRPPRPKDETPLKNWHPYTTDDPSPHFTDHSRDGSTMIRLTIGSHETIAMGGAMPGLAVFDDFGARIGETVSASSSTVPGSFVDIEIIHKAGVGHVRPSYLLAQGGEKPICISSMSLLYADGARQVITGDDLAVCHRLATNESRSFIGAGYEQPHCFWLQDSATETQGYFKRVSFHLPDFVWSSIRRAEYKKNSELLCRHTPRFGSWGAKKNGDPEALSYPIAIFNPLIEYDPVTNYDKHPERILKWEWDGHDLRDFSDRPFKSRSSVGRREQGSGTDVNDSEYNSTKAINASDQYDKEHERVRTEAPHLVVSHSAISAQDQCLDGQWNHTDYVSLTENIYCDMQSQSMFWMCDGHRKENCWDLATGTLQGLEAARNYQTLNMGMGMNQDLGVKLLAHTHQSWSATGPLFGFAYPNITLIG